MFPMNQQALFLCSSRKEYTYDAAMMDVKRLRNLQLYVKWFNKAHCYLIFLLKLCAITLCILNGYAAIAHFSEHPVFGTTYYAMLLDMSLLYSIVYEKAFQIPSQFTQAVQEILVHLPKGRNRKGQAVAKQLRSISKLGIKVGEFHTFERASTPVFIDFVITNVVNMLMAHA